MESFLPSEIARLVLGYLEEQKCDEAYQTFLKTSPLLKECLKMKEDGRKFRTQVLGSSLLDILYEYSAIYSLVHERLKKVDPETADSLKNSGSLLDKVTFLVNATSSGQTMLFSITLPPGNSPQASTVAHVRKRLKTTGCDKRKESLRKQFRPQSEETNHRSDRNDANNRTSNLETTSLSSLPGYHNTYSDFNDYTTENIIKTPKRKPNLSSARRSRANSNIPEENEDNLDLTILTKAFLDNHELHEKIAENINKVICTPELSATSNTNAGLESCGAQNVESEASTSFCVSNNFTMELDNAIKKIVHQTESDPVFENFLHEVIGPVTEETSDDCDDKGISNTSTPCIPMLAVESKSNENLSKEDPSDPKESSQTSTVVTTCPETTTTEKTTAVVAAQSVESTVTIDSTPVTVSSTGDALVLDKQPSPQKNLVPNQINNNLVMVSQPNSVQQQSTFVITDYQPSLMQDNRIFLVGNKLGGIGSHILTVQPTQFQLTQPTTMVNENDLLAMPTLIMCGDDRQQAFVLPAQPTPLLAPPTPVPTTCIKKKKKTYPVPILPRDDNSTSDQELNTNKDLISITATDTIKYKINVQAVPETSKATEKSSSQPVENCVLSVPMIPVSDKKVDKNDEPKASTPEKTEKSGSKVQVSLSTPRNSRSHIRALDFSTPPKESPTLRKANTSPKSMRGVKPKSPKSATKHIRSCLFTSPVKGIPIATRSPMAKLTGDWDKVQGAGLIFGAEKSPKKENIAVNKQTKKTPAKKTEAKKVIKKPSRPRRAIPVKSKQKPVVEQTVEVLEETDPLEIVKVEIKEEIETKVVTKPRLKKGGSWDQDLRALIAPQPVSSVSTTVRRKRVCVKKSPKRTRANTKTTKTKAVNSPPSLNKTEDAVKSIEAELAKLEGIEVVEEVIPSNTTNKETPEPGPSTEPDIKTEKVTKRKRQTNKSKNIPQKPEEDNPQVELKKEENTPEELETVEENSEQSKEGLLRNMKPRLKKKCNVGNASKKVATNQDEQSQKPTTTDLKQEETTEEVKSMTILSPSKMNANKRTLVEHESTKDMVDATKEPIVTTQSDTAVQNTLTVELPSNNEIIDNKITPDMCKPSYSNVISVKRNLTPILETPMKMDAHVIPLTPGLGTPFSIFGSPFSNIMSEKCGTVDLSLIPTPSFPITPSIPITPNLHSGDTQSSYASRPTDYSNSSSYYQPLDNEHNQKLEQILIDECVKFESAKRITTSTPSRPESSPPAEPNPQKQEYIIPEMCIPVEAEEQVVEMPVEGKIAKANLSTTDSANVSQNSTVSSQSSTCTSDSSCTSSNSDSSDSDSSEDLQNQQDSNNTVIHLSPVRYTLRRSSRNTKIAEDNSNKREERIVQPLKIILPKKRVLKKSPVKQTEPETVKKVEDPVVTTANPISIVKKSHKSLLEELEDKRKRIISEMKSTGKEKPKNTRKKVITKKNTSNIPLVQKRRGRKRKSIPIQESEPEDEKIPEKIKDKMPEIIKIPRKSTTPRKMEGIESVAARLRKGKTDENKVEREKSSDELNSADPKETIPDTEERKQSASSPCLSTASNDYSFTSTKDKNQLDQSLNLEEEEIPRLHISSDEEERITENNSLQTSSVSCPQKTEDPEELIQGLKERGIHLIPKKPLEKKIDNDEQSNKNKTKIINENVPSKKIDTRETVEESKTETNLDKQDKNKKIQIKSDVYLDNEEKIDLSKIKSDQIIITDTILGKSSKNNKIEHVPTSQPNSETEKPTIEIQEPKNQIENTENISIEESVSETEEFVIIDEDFHVKITTEDSPEFISLVYDESTACKKKISDYNLGVLSRTISAKVFIEELNIEQDRHLTITPCMDLLSISPKKQKVVKKKSSDSVTEKTTKSQIKPLNILYNALVNNTSLVATTNQNNESKPSKNKDTTSNTKTSNDTAKTKTQGKGKQTSINDKKEKIEGSNNLERKEKQKTKVVRDKNVEERAKPEQSTTNLVKSGGKKTISLEQYKNKCVKKNSELGNEVVTTKNKSDIVSDSKDGGIVPHNEESTMTTAASSEKDQSTDGMTQETNSKKRKASIDGETAKQNTDKRLKPNTKHELLRTLDVDSFLSKLHGPS